MCIRDRVEVVGEEHRVVDQQRQARGCNRQPLQLCTVSEKVGHVSDKDGHVSDKVDHFSVEACAQA
eukprot:2716262-Rhodomonas_salina.1